MKPQTAGNRNSSADQHRRTRNPFHGMDVPDPNDQDVLAFAIGAKLAGTPDDENANAMSALGDRDQHGTIEVHWSSRWSGGAGPTIRGDAANKWKSGQAEVKAAVEEPSWPLALLKAGIDTSTRTFAMFSIATAASHRRGRLARIAGRVVRLVRTLELALQVRHERRLLLAMDDRTLKDLGLYGVAYGEATRPFWDVGIDVSGGHYPLRGALRKEVTS